VGFQQPVSARGVPGWLENDNNAALIKFRDFKCLEDWFHLGTEVFEQKTVYRLDTCVDRETGLVTPVGPTYYMRKNIKNY